MKSDMVEVESVASRPWLLISRELTPVRVARNTVSRPHRDDYWAKLCSIGWFAGLMALVRISPICSAADLYRVPDDRPPLAITVEQLKKLEIGVFESTRLK